MKKNFSRHFLCLLVCLLYAVSSFAEDEEFTVGNFTYIVGDGGLIVSGLSDDGKTKTEVTIPSSIKMWFVTSNVIGVADNAFKGNTTLERVNFSANLKSIGKRAFYGASLTSINIPSTLVNVEAEAFARNLKLTSATIACRHLKEYAMSGCTALSDLTLTTDVKQIGDGAFLNCKSLKNIDLPADECTFGSEVFFGCYPTSMSIGAGYKTSTGGLLENIYTLPNLAIDNTYFLTGELSLARFLGTKKVKDITLEAHQYEIGPNVFCGFSSLETITFNTNMNIGDNAFRGCSKLRTLSLTANVIGKNAFMDCYTAGTAKIKANKIGERAFAGCTGLTQLDVDASAIGQSAFEGCKNLISTTLSSLTKSNKTQFRPCFQGCTGSLNLLTTLLPDYEPNDAYNPFNGAAFSTIQLAAPSANLIQNCVLLSKVNMYYYTTRIVGGFLYNCPKVSEFGIVDDNGDAYTGSGSSYAIHADGNLYSKNNVLVQALPTKSTVQTDASFAGYAVNVLTHYTGVMDMRNTERQWYVDGEATAIKTPLLAGYWGSINYPRWSSLASYLSNFLFINRPNDGDFDKNNVLDAKDVEKLVNVLLEK